MRSKPHIYGKTCKELVDSAAFVRGPVRDIAMCMRVIAYIASTAGLGVIYHRQTKASAAHHIRASADASHQTDPVTRKSCSGYVCFLNGGALNWSSKSQQIITLSSCESEIVACVDAVKDVILLRRLLEDQRGTKEPPTEVDQDNTSAIRIIENPELVLLLQPISYNFCLFSKVYLPELFPALLMSPSTPY